MTFSENRRPLFGVMRREADMARENDTADRLRKALKGKRNVTEKVMFGGICFMLRDHMLGGSGSGGFMFRVGVDREAGALARSGATRVEMGGREYRGFVWVDPKRCKDADLPGWIALAEGYIKTLPPKPAKKPKKPVKARARRAAVKKPR
jgi:hypothetical protein